MTDTVPLDWPAIGERLEAEHPKLVSLANPRTYATEEGYLSSRSVAYRLSMFSLTLSRLRQRASHDLLIGIIGSSSGEVIKYGVQPWWISEALVEALMKTSPPAETTLREVPLPYSAFVLLLPRGALISPNGSFVQMLLVSRMSNEVALLYGLETAGEVKEHGALAISCFDETGSMNAHTYYSWRPLNQSLGEWEASTQEPMTIHGKIAVPLPDDKKFSANFVRLALNACFIISEHAEMIEGPKVLKRIKARIGNGKIELWSPRWVGRSFRRPLPTPGIETGSHASPRLHWRRGHWRDQRHGEALQLRKRLWIQPTIVNAEAPPPDQGGPETP